MIDVVFRKMLRWDLVGGINQWAAIHEWPVVSDALLSSHFLQDVY